MNVASVKSEYYTSLYAQYCQTKPDASAVPSVRKLLNSSFQFTGLLPRHVYKKNLAIVDYASLKGDEENRLAAKSAHVTLSELNGGLGITIKRNRYLRRVLGLSSFSEIQLRPKSLDLFFSVGNNSKDKKCVEEIRLLNLCKASSMYRCIWIQQLIKKETKAFFDEFFRGISCLEHLRKSNVHIRKPIFDNKYPTIDFYNGMLDYRELAPGGHGEVGFVELLNPKEKIQKGSIKVICNGNSVNTSLDPYIVGWMLRYRIPLVIVTKTKGKGDINGGHFGMCNNDNTYVLDMAEIHKNDLDIYGDLVSYKRLVKYGENPQLVNTNTIYINESELHPFLKALRKIVSKDKFVDIIKPDLIKNAKEVNGKKLIQLESSLVTPFLSLGKFLDTTSVQKVRTLKAKYGIKKLITLVNLTEGEALNFCTPIKYAFDLWVQASSDRFYLDQNGWLLLSETKRKLYLDKDFIHNEFYQDLENCYSSFGNASTISLDSLNIKGKVNLKDAILIGDVSINSDFPGIFDLNSSFGRKQLGQLQNERVVLKDVRINIGESGVLHSLKNRTVL